MKRIFLATILGGLAAAALAFSQGWTTTGGIITTSGATGICSNCLTTIASSGFVDLNDHTAGIETRKDDGKGPTLAQVKYSALPVSEKSLAPANYLAVAKSIGLDPSAPSDEAQLLSTLRQHGFRVYDFTKVDNYLYRQALRQSARTRWVWKPARAADLKVAQSSSSRYYLKPGLGVVFPAQYAKRIPIEALTDMKCVLDSLKEAAFFISDYEVVHPDPFLAVTTPRLLEEGKIWIIDQWDEPGFQEKPVSVPLRQETPPARLADRLPSREVFSALSR